MKHIALCAFLLAGCGVSLPIPQDLRATCSSDSDCPGSYICATGAALCVRQTSECVAEDPSNGQLGLVRDGVVCRLAGGSDGICRGGICAGSMCGDGIATPPEQCDPGLAALSFTPDMCRPNCMNPACGDGVRDNGEECDLGPSNSDNGVCTTRCTANFCGDGFRGLDEECDDGNQSQFDGCLNDCRRASCGDGFVQAGVEQCDDGNDAAGDGCTGCRNPECGNGVKEGIEECDDGNANDSDGCLSTCSLARCGDGKTFQGVEECDDGGSNGDGVSLCTSACRNNRCSDGYRVSAIEQCDLGTQNGVYGSACTASCRNNTCGDGHVGGTETCDEGGNNGVTGGRCTAACRIDTCGNGFRGVNEQCDDNNASDNDGCSSSCKTESYCTSFAGLSCPSGAVRYCTPMPVSCSTDDQFIAQAICSSCNGSTCARSNDSPNCDSYGMTFTRSGISTWFFFGSGMCAGDLRRYFANGNTAGEFPDWCPIFTP